jgi:SAM-dependent methyltransferase
MTAAMNRDLVGILADPETGEALSLSSVDEERDGQIVTGQLRSESGRTFAIVRGIPRFVPPDSYASNFGLQWNAFRKEQLDNEQGSSLSRQRFERETGWSDAAVSGRWMLDAGCGAGRFAQVAAQKGARLVAVDLSSAVDAAAETMRAMPNVDIIQGDIAKLPLKRGVFDFAYSIGVIQHTPDRARCIQSVARAVKAGGAFTFTIYPRKPWTKLHGKYFARHVTKRLPSEYLLKGVEAVMPALFEFGDRVFPLPAIGKVARFASPFAVYLESERPGWTREQRYRESLLDTYDMLSPRFDEPMTESEVRDALESLHVAGLSFPTMDGLVARGVR